MKVDTSSIRVTAPVRSQVEEALRRAIVDGGFAPGARLIERDLCERFGVSRPLLREALRQLEADQLVETSANRGLSVAPTRATESPAPIEPRACGRVVLPWQPEGVARCTRSTRSSSCGCGRATGSFHRCSPLPPFSPPGA